MDSEPIDKEKKLCILFKSEPRYFTKEKEGIKNNTARIKQESFDKRFDILNHFFENKINNLNIIIQNTETLETFERKVKDVSKFDVVGKVLYIITWEV